MAQATLVLGTPTHFSAGDWVQWDERDSGLGDLSAFSADSDPRILIRLRIFEAGRLQFQVIDVPDGSSGFGSREDLSDAWVAFASALTVSANGSSFVANGPGVADAAEPYQWSNGHAADQSAWFAAYEAAGRPAVTITVDDGVPVATVHDAAVAPILFGAPSLAAAAETVDATVDATVAPILFGAPTLAAAAETVDATVDATVAPILFGAPTLAAAAETVDATVDATVAPILFGAPTLAAAAETVDATVDATVAPILFGAPTLTVSAAAETVAAPAFEGFLAPDGDRVLTGAAAAAQRLADALRIQRGSYPFLRDYGSMLALLVDRRPPAVFAAVAEAIIHPANGLDDIQLRAVRVSPAGAGAVVVEVDAEWRPAPAAASTPISIREQLQPAP